VNLPVAYAPATGVNCIVATNIVKHNIIAITTPFHFSLDFGLSLYSPPYCI